MSCHTATDTHTITQNTLTTTHNHKNKLVIAASCVSANGQKLPPACGQSVVAAYGTKTNNKFCMICSTFDHIDGVLDVACFFFFPRVFFCLPSIHLPASNSIDASARSLALFCLVVLPA
eukprot:m.254964 g.254964  ORF g.254964 m.254964 type:complete len:119 (-) comp19152_c2_seq5:1286-1642(-)